MAKNVLSVDYNDYDLPKNITESSIRDFGKIIAEEISKQKEEVNYLIVPSGQIVDIVCSTCGTLESYFNEVLNEKIKNSKVKFISTGFGYNKGKIKEHLEESLGKLNLLPGTSLGYQYVLYEIIIPKNR